MLTGNFFFAAECDSPLAMSIPDSKWSASATADRSKYGAHLARLSNTADTVGWCFSSSKETKRPFIQVSLVHHLLTLNLSDWPLTSCLNGFLHKQGKLMSSAPSSLRLELIFFWIPTPMSKLIKLMSIQESPRFLGTLFLSRKRE